MICSTPWPLGSLTTLLPPPPGPKIFSCPFHTHGHTLDLIITNNSLTLECLTSRIPCLTLSPIILHYPCANSTPTYRDLPIHSSLSPDFSPQTIPFLALLMSLAPSPSLYSSGNPYPSLFPHHPLVQHLHPIVQLFSRNSLYRTLNSAT